MQNVEDVRDKYKADETPNHYYEGLLPPMDKEFVKGYDWCCEEVVDEFFNNLEVYFEKDSHIMHMLQEELPKEKQTEYEITYTFGDRPSETRQVKTYLDDLRSKFLDWLETNRSPIIISLIDSMKDKDYDKNYEKEFGHKPD